MLSLTKRTEYSLIALAYLAARREKTVSAREVAEAFNMPVALVMNILKVMQQARILTSRRGTKGGYRLTANLSEITMHRLIEVLEGPVRLAECVIVEHERAGCRNGPCKIRQGCPIQAPIKALHGQMVKFLRDISLEDILGTAVRHSASGATETAP